MIVVIVGHHKKGVVPYNYSRTLHYFSDQDDLVGILPGIVIKGIILDEGSNISEDNLVFLLTRMRHQSGLGFIITGDEYQKNILNGVATRFFPDRLPPILLLEGQP